MWLLMPKTLLATFGFCKRCLESWYLRPGTKICLCFFLHVFCYSMFSLEIFSTHLTLICFKCLLHIRKHLYEVIFVTFKIKWYKKNISKKAHKFFCFPVKDIKISDNCYKIQKFLRLCWASVITHKHLLHLLIWM